MTRTRINKLVAVFLAMLITLAFGAYVPINNVQAASQADAIVSIALAEEGYTEGANNYNKYGAALGQNNVAWCALFISWCARQAGIPTSIIKTTAWAGDMGSSKRTGNFGGQYYPKGSITPQKGDIVYYDWNRNGSSDHVEIVISTSGSTFTSIGGNTKGDSGSTEGVRRHSNYSFTSSYIVGFERPNYSGEPVPINDDELGIPYPRPSGSPLLSTGSKGSGVSWLQTALNKANNAGLAVDGDFGSNTKQAVINFQKANGLDADGIAGPATINKLVEVIKNKMKPTVPPRLIFSTKTVNLDLSGANSATVNITADGSLPSTYNFNCNRDTSAMSTKWGGWSGNTNPLTISGLKTGVYTIKVSLKNADTDQSVYTDTITVNITCSHKYTAKVVAPTCTSKGYTLHTCSVCSNSYKDNETNAAGHKFGSWTTTKSATCTADGSKTRTCFTCGATETQTISKTGHNYTAKIVSSTFTEKGYTLHTCSVCGDSYKDNYTEMKIKGDINNDSSVGVSDVVFLQNYLVKSMNISSEQFLAADMNSDSQVNVFDCVILKRRILMLD